MRKTVRVAIASFFCLALAAPAAQPALYETVWFDLTGNGGLKDQYVFQSDGLTLTVTPAIFSNSGTITNQGQVGQYSGGLGVTNSSGDAHWVDGNGNNDLLKLAFSEVIVLKEIWFYGVESDDEFRFFYEDSGQLVMHPYGDVDISGTGIGHYEFQQTWLGDLFGIGAKGDNDEFKLKKVKVKKVDHGYEVPLPPALPLMAGGMIMLGLVGWRGRHRQTRTT